MYGYTQAHLPQQQRGYTQSFPQSFPQSYPQAYPQSYPPQSYPQQQHQQPIYYNYQAQTNGYQVTSGATIPAHYTGGGVPVTTTTTTTAAPGLPQSTSMRYPLIVPTPIKEDKLKTENTRLMEENRRLTEQLAKRAGGADPGSSEFSFQIGGQTVKVIFAQGIPTETREKAFGDRKFQSWCRAMQKEVQEGRLAISSVEFQSVDMFGPTNVGFIKFKAAVKDVATGKDVPAIVFARGNSVAILPVLLAEDGQRYTILTVQRRIPIADMAYEEIPAGMMDDKSDFKGVAAKELQEETGIVINGKDLVDLTANSTGIAPSPGGCDEMIRLFVFEQRVSASQMEDFKGRLTGNLHEGEMITLKVIPLHQIYSLTDVKGISALALYEQAIKEGRHKPAFL